MVSLLFWRLRFATLPGIWDLGFGVSIAHTLTGRKRHWRLEAVQSASEKEGPQRANPGSATEALMIPKLKTL